MKNYLLIIFLLLLNISYSQKDKFYKSIEEAKINPDSVYILDLSNKNLDSIPKEIVLFKNLWKINFSNNNITYLPSCLFELSNLKVLILSNNKITEISDLIENLINLEVVFIDHNNLSDLPITITKLTNLKLFNADYNTYLVGRISKEKWKAIKKHKCTYTFDLKKY